MGESAESGESVKRQPPPGSQAWCAAQLGFSPAYLSKLKKQGRIRSEPDGTWSPESVRAQIEASADPAAVLATVVRNQLAAPPEQRAAAAEVAAATDAMTDAQIEALYGPDPRQNLLIANSLRAREAATRERLARLTDEGKTGLVEDVDRRGYTAARAVRDAVLRECTKVAPLLAPVTDAWELERMLAEAMRRALTEAADGLR